LSPSRPSRAGDGHEEVAAGVADERLDVPLLVGPAHQAEVGLEEVVALQAEERVGEPPLPAAGDLRHGDLQVVVADPPGDAAEEGEGAGVPLEERLGALAREGAAEERVGVRQGHDEDGHLGRPAVERDRGLAEVGLGLAGRVGQRDEDLGVAALPGADGVLDDGQAAGVAVLVAEPPVDPDGGVPLLPGGLAVVLEDLVDDRQERLEDRRPLGRGAAVARRLGVREDLAEGLPMDAVLAAGGASAQAVDEDATADLGPVLHVGEHPCAPLLVPPVVGQSRPPSWAGGSGSDQGRCTFRPPFGYPAGRCTFPPPFRGVSGMCQGRPGATKKGQGKSPEALFVSRLAPIRPAAPRLGLEPRT
jgi:hypothetical protein